MATPAFTVEIGWTSSLASKIVFGQSYFALNTGAAAFSVSNIARTSNVATITTSSAHGYSTGAIVNVSGITANTTFNAGSVTITVTSTTAFTYANTGTNVASTPVTAGSVTLTSNVTCTGLFSNTFSQAYSGTYDDVTQYVETIHIKRGRDDLLTSMQAGTCDLVLCNPTNPQWFNPAAEETATTGPNTQTPGIVPMRPVRISATPTGGTRISIWQGYIRDASYQLDGVVGKLNLTCVDLMMWLARVKPQDVATVTGYAVITKALTSNVATLTFSASHPFAVNDVVLVQGVDTTFNGTYTVTATTSTTISYAKTAANVASTTATGSIALVISSAAMTSDPGFQLDKLVNRQEVSRLDATAASAGTAAGISQVAQNDVSTALFGVSDGTAISTYGLNDDNAALALAQYIVNIKSSFQTPLIVTLDCGTTSSQALQINLDLQDRVTVTNTMAGISGDYIVEAIEHSISDAGQQWISKYTLSRYGAPAFIFGSSTQGTFAPPNKPWTVTNKALTSNVATLTLSDSTTGLVAGQPLVVSGVDATFNGTWVILSVASTTVSYARTNANVASTAATGTVTNLIYSACLSTARPTDSTYGAANAYIYETDADVYRQNTGTLAVPEWSVVTFPRLTY